MSALLKTPRINMNLIDHSTQKTVQIVMAVAPQPPTLESGKRRYKSTHLSVIDGGGENATSRFKPALRLIKG